MRGATIADVGERNTGGPWACAMPVGLGKGSSSKDCAMARADLRQILADWWLLKGKLVLCGGGGGSGSGGTMTLPPGGIEDDTVPALPSGEPRVPSEEDGERPVELVVGGVLMLLPLLPLVLKGLTKVLHEQVGQRRGSLSSAELRDFRSQCFREKTGMSKNAQ